MFTEVVKAEYVDGYRIRLWFNNQVTKVVDLHDSQSIRTIKRLGLLSEIFRQIQHNRMGKRSRFCA